MKHRDIKTEDGCVSLANAGGSSSVVLVCEHASNDIPARFNGLGLSADDRKSHAAWDPGALGVAQSLSRHLDAPLVSSRISRLVYDCNRPPEAPDAMPERSEVIEVPGNRSLSAIDRNERVAAYYLPFRAALSRTIQQMTRPIIVTVHSFTPVYHGALRTVEIGVLHDSDTRLADAMLQTADAHTRADVQRNQPYGPEHGVTHTLKEHAIRDGHLNVMLEIRNDLIASTEQQENFGAMIAGWLVDAVALIGIQGDVKCHA
ncbi:N-formylglutamate amidohydrolase [Boseongicola aestuarii]|uniref:N-formylglutamate amidohydrolase n=1 Tax=Boseongicola aestuarii TaxID=1470561 RepID=A0A238IYZ9_9RHOB|nr:N-formylglutamate amidohydrolase [Boseongicola aestuarii]SMX23719.1 N-formylglutamate amidohydrolase [Boseongicola aestuarii]